MDHVPRPTNSEIPHLEVPFLDPIPYQLGTFHSFWCDAGFEDTGSEDADSKLLLGPTEHDPSRCRLDRDRSVEDYARLIQSWLYFGFLSEYLEQVVDPSEFVRVTAQNERVVTSAKFLAQIKPPKEEDDSHLVKDEIIDEELRLEELLEETRSYLAEMETLPCAKDHPLPMLFLSVHVLLSSLYHEDFDYPQSDPELPSTQFLARRLKSLGWCPQTVQKICATHRPNEAYFFSLLRRHEREGTNHCLCSESRCIANSVLDGPYQSRHVAPSCSCPAISVDQETLASIIRQGRIPIVNVEVKNNTQEVKLKLQPAKAQNQYVALSHVWADGLGNPSSNSLPKCQIMRIAKQVSALPAPDSCGKALRNNTGADFVQTPPEGASTKSFWLDTLCIPVNSQDLRVAAINKMAAVYAGASHVLVLDSELQQLKLGCQPYLDHLGHIISSTWATRSWTLQEGGLSNLCYFQFEDDALNPIGEGLKKTIERSLNQGAPPNLSAVFRYAFQNFEKFVQMHKDKVETEPESLTYMTLVGRLRKSLMETLFHDRRLREDIDQYTGARRQRAYAVAVVDAWNMLANRSTSQPADLPLILCNLLDFNSYEILRIVSNDERMRIMLRSFSRLPLPLLFSQAPRYKYDCDNLDRWIPTAIVGILPRDGLTMHVRKNDVKISTRHNHDGEGPQLIILPLRKIEDELLLALEDETALYKVEAFRSSNDTLKIDGKKYSATGILAERGVCGRHHQIRGACVHLMDEIDLAQGASGKMRLERPLSVAYDCPVTISPLLQPLPDQCLDNDQKWVPHHIYNKFKLLIQCGTPPSIPEADNSSLTGTEPLPPTDLLTRRAYPIALHSRTLYLSLFGLFWLATAALPYFLWFIEVCQEHPKSPGEIIKSFFIFGLLANGTLCWIGIPITEPIFLWLLIKPARLRKWIVLPILLRASVILNYSKYIVCFVYFVGSVMWSRAEYSRWISSFEEGWKPVNASWTTMLEDWVDQLFR